MRSLRVFGMALGLVVSACGATAQALDMFKDVGHDEPLYKIGSRLSKAGFRFPPMDGGVRYIRHMTRYEYAVSLDRMLIYLRAAAAGKSPRTPEVAFSPGPKQATGDQLNDLAGMWRELRKEMTSMLSPKERKETGTWLAREVQRAELSSATGDTRGVVLLDLDPAHWAFEAVMSLKKKGIITGYPDGQFRGARAMTRDELASALEAATSALIHRRGISRVSSYSERIVAKCSSSEQPPDSVPIEPFNAARPENSAERTPSNVQAPDMFKEVPLGHWLYEVAEQLADAGVIWGYRSSYFSGKRELTRYEFAIALDRALQVVHVTGVDHRLQRKSAFYDERVYTLRTHEIELLFKMMTELRDELRSMGTGSADLEGARIWLLQAWGRAEKTYRNPAVPVPLRSTVRREPARFDELNLETRQSSPSSFKDWSVGPSMSASYFGSLWGSRLSPLFDNDRSRWTGTKLELRP